MCGIAGIFSLSGKPVAQEEVQAMCDGMTHRGPNDEGYYADSAVVLGMRRLSIIDIDGGHQPVHNEDRSVWAVFNGEIYNFKALRALLERQGHSFYTDTDTEVIVHLYVAIRRGLRGQDARHVCLRCMGRSAQETARRP